MRYALLFAVIVVASCITTAIFYRAGYDSGFSNGWCMGWFRGVNRTVEEIHGMYFAGEEYDEPSVQELIEKMEADRHLIRSGGIDSNEIVSINGSVRKFDAGSFAK